MHSQSLAEADFILSVDSVVSLAQSDLHGVSVGQQARPSDQEVGERVIRERSIEAPLPISERDVGLVHLHEDGLRAKRKMMPPADDIDVIRILELIPGEDRRG